jgi:hypothetical protein
VACFNKCPSGVLKTTPTPPAPLTDDPSILTYHLFSGPSSDGSSSAIVNSAMKSARACALIACLGRYSISNSLNSTAHWISLPTASRLIHCFAERMVCEDDDFM